MTQIEAKGKTVQDALRVAAQQLGVTEENVAYEVLEQPSKGFLGIGGSPAKIKAWIKSKPETQKKYVSSESEKRSESSPRNARFGKNYRSQRRGKETAQARSKSSEQRKKQVDSPQTSVQPVASNIAPAAVTSKAECDMLLKLLEDTLAAMEIDATPQLRSETDEEIIVDLVGPDVAILIGKHGQTLDALQFLIGVALGRSRLEGKRIILDAEGYRERHAETLRKKALDWAKEVKRTGQEAVLDPQPARDRRVIHTALADDPDVYTYSEGEGDHRHVVISPRK